MKLINNIVYVDWSDLRGWGISDRYLSKVCTIARRDGLNSWANRPDPEDKRRCLVQYDSIPSRTRSKLPTLESLLAEAKGKAVASAQLQAALVADYQAGPKAPLVSCLQLELKDRAQALLLGVSLQDATAIMRLAAWLRLSQQTQEGYQTREGYLRALVEVMAQEYAADLIYGATISNWQVLDRKAKAYLKEGLKSLVDGRAGNQNALRLTPEHQLFVLELARQGNKLDDTYIHALLMESIKHPDWSHLEPVSRQTVSRWLRQPQTEALLARYRYGKAYARTKVEPFHLRALPKYSLSLVCGDGWSMGLPVNVPFGHPLLPMSMWRKRASMGNKGSMKTTLMVYIWFDAATGAILGYDFDVNEPTALIRKSLRNLLHTTGGRVPLEAMLDRKSMENEGVKSMMTSLGIQFDDSKEPNAPWQNLAERNNKELGKWLRRMELNWVNRTAHNKEFTHNPDIETRRNDMIIDADDAMQKFVRLVAMYNQDVADNKPYRLTDALNRINPACATMDDLNRIMLFGQHRKTSVHNGFIELTVDSRKYTYELPDLFDFERKAIGKQVWVQLDEAEMDSIYVLLPDAQRPDDAAAANFYCQAKEAGRYNISRAERTSEERAELSRQVKRGKHYRAQLEAENLRLMEEAEQRGTLALGRSVGQELAKRALADELVSNQQDYVLDGWRDKGSRFSQVEPDQTAELVLVDKDPTPTQKQGSISAAERRRIMDAKLRALE
jgi:hypothetical protein